MSVSNSYTTEGEASALCDKLASCLALAAGHAFQDRDAWEKLARQFAKELDALSPATNDSLREKP